MVQPSPGERVKYRDLKGLTYYLFCLSAVIAIILAIIYVFGISVAGFFFMSWSYYLIFMGLLFPFVFLLFPPFPITKSEAGKVPIYDVILAILAFVIPMYLSTVAPILSQRPWAFSPPMHLLIFASILCLLVLEACRRTGGIVFSLISLFFTTYPLYAHFLPGVLKGIRFSFPATVGHHIYGADGILGIPLTVIAELLIGFLLFAGLLIATGAGSFFLRLAMGLAGGFRGGPAKVAVVSSGFMGSLTGSIFANIISTGSITIPAMKKTGFKPYFAGAVEACASTGGVLMPPVMGAVAFVMASMTDIPYHEICLAAFIPSFFFYLALLLQVDLHSTVLNIKGLSKDQIPLLKETLKDGWHFLFVLFFLIFALLVWRMEERAPFYACGLLILLSMLKKNSRIQSKKHMLSILESIGKILVETLGIIVPLGLIISGITITGMAPSFASGVISLSHGIPFFALILGAVASYILGMVGLLTPAYIFLAVTLAPPLVKSGFNLMGVHLFVMYYAMLSAITLPVAVGSFLAASIAGAAPMRTALQSMRLAIVLYILPFFFVYRPELILQGDSVFVFLFHFITCLIGIVCLSCAMEGYVYRVGKIGKLARLWFLIGGLLTAAPIFSITLLGFGLILIGLFAIILSNKYSLGSRTDGTREKVENNVV